jgi:hypothetical protein
VLQLVEEALDQVALPIESMVDRALRLAVARGRNVSASATAFDQLNDGARIIAAVGDEVAICLEPFNQGRCDGLIG